VENSNLRRKEISRRLYLSRKTFAFNADNPGEMKNQNRDVFRISDENRRCDLPELDSAEDFATDVKPLLDSDPQT